MKPDPTVNAFCPCCHKEALFGTFVRSSVTDELVCKPCDKALETAEAAYLSRL